MRERVEEMVEKGQKLKFLIKSWEKVWWVQKFDVPLHSLTKSKGV